MSSAVVASGAGRQRWDLLRVGGGEGRTHSLTSSAPSSSKASCERMKVCKRGSLVMNREARDEESGDNAEGRNRGGGKVRE